MNPVNYNRKYEEDLDSLDLSTSLLNNMKKFKSIRWAKYLSIINLIETKKAIEPIMGRDPITVPFQGVHICIFTSKFIFK